MRIGRIPQLSAALRDRLAYAHAVELALYSPEADPQNFIALKFMSLVATTLDFKPSWSEGVRHELSLSIGMMLAPLTAAMAVSIEGMSDELGMHPVTLLKAFPWVRHVSLNGSLTHLYEITDSWIRSRSFLFAQAFF